MRTERAHDRVDDDEETEYETDYDLGGALTDPSKLWMSDEIATLYKTSQDQNSWPCRIVTADFKRSGVKNC